MFETILTISGKPGLYRMLSRGNNMFIVETVDATHKRIPVYNSDKIVLLDDIAIYTDTEEIPLRKVFETIYAKEAAVLSFNIKETTPEELKEYFELIKYLLSPVLDTCNGPIRSLAQNGRAPLVTDRYSR